MFTPLLEDLNTVPVERLVDLVEVGAKQLSEIPTKRRSQVKGGLARRAYEVAEAAESDGGPDEPTLEDREAELSALTVAELLVITRDYESITGEHSMRKAELIEAILDAEGEEDASKE